MNRIEAGKNYLFTKSGNEVRTIAPTTRYRGQAMWEVERVSGASAGKRMDVPERALEPVANDNHVLFLNTPEGNACLVLARQGRAFMVRSFAVQDRDELGLAFAPQVPGFENLDTGSSVAQRFKLSTMVRYGDVVLTNTVMRADSFEALEKTLKRAQVRVFNHQEF
jgi:hypothetical protein